MLIQYSIHNQKIFEKKNKKKQKNKKLNIAFKNKKYSEKKRPRSQNSNGPISASIYIVSLYTRYAYWETGSIWNVSTENKRSV